MLNIIVSFFNVSSDFIQTFCFICHQASKFPMQRMMLAAVQATEERLIAPRYLMQISAQLAFSITKHVLLALKKHASPCESDLHEVILPTKRQQWHVVCYRAISAVTSPDLIFIHDVTVTSS